MKHQNRARLLTYLAVVVALFASACTGSTTPTATESTTPSTDEEPATVEAEFGFGTQDLGLTEEGFNTAIEGVQRDLATCMSDAGFEYVPADVETIVLAKQAVRTEPGMSRREYKEQFGFGETTRFDNRLKEIEMGERNLAIYDALSDADQTAYDRTLFGDDPDATFAFQLDEEDFEPIGGCTRVAVEANFTAEQLDPNFSNPKDVLVEEDSRVVAAELAWIDCMGASGYDYTDQDEIIEEYQDRLDELLDGDDPESLSPAKSEVLAELQQEEIAVSLVDLECQIAHTDDIVAQVELEVFGTTSG